MNSNADDVFVTILVLFMMIVSSCLTVWVCNQNRKSDTILDQAQLRYNVCIENAATSDNLSLEEKRDKVYSCSKMYDPIIKYLREEKERRINESKPISN